MTSSTADQTQQQPCRRFSLSEIKSATGDFSDAHVIGKGGFGKVYKGLIDNGSVTVAVKRLASNSKQGEREFAAEMETLTKFRHRNLVSLIGFCSEEEEMILVYEYMANGTLADHLYKLSTNISFLSWNARLKVCIGAGRGLDYLHSGCSIIHRDVKSTNILLDDNFTAKVSDFGLAKHLSLDVLQSHVSTVVKGSFGYLDPSYFTTGRLTRASDTYAFGVVLLEVLSGRPAVGRSLAANEQCLTRWVQEKIRRRKHEQIVDPNLRAGEIISQDCLKTFVEVAVKCLHPEPEKRLTMTRAVAQLELALEQQERKGMTAARSQFWPFWNRVLPSGSRQKDHKEISAPAIEQEDEAKPIATPDIVADHIVNMLPIYVPAIPPAEIKEITDDFSSKCLIVDGVDFTRRNVFHGVLKSGQDAVIIKLKEKLPDDKFIAQVSLISRLVHDNVVELVGYCLDGDLQVLVHEFPPRGSLHDILLGRQCIKGLYLGPCGPPLSWAQRVKIAVGIATGLCYIHDKDLVHHNIKSRNVLLFDNDIAKITNLHPSPQRLCKEAYLKRFHPLGSPPCTADYPPEYGSGETDPTQKGDVYSFGVVLLELLTGSTEYDRTREVRPSKLVLWAEQQLGSDKVHKIVDARLKADYPPKAVEKMAAVAQLCLQYEAEYRPDMSLVLRDLKLMLPKSKLKLI